jgi:anti-sigma factor RsiW
MHVDTELIGYLKGELSPAEHEQVARHLDACGECRSAHDDFREILGQLQASVPEPPPIHWGRWRAELRARVEAARGRQRARWWGTWVGVPLAAAVAVAALVVSLDRPAPVVELTPVEQAALGSHLDLLRDYRAVERLDLLEDIEVIGQLDQLQPRNES